MVSCLVASACDRVPANVLRSAPADAAAQDAGQPSVETACDGVDNDGDGVVDNVDIAGDGICDCLRIATLGSALYPNDDTFDAWLTAQSSGVAALGTEVLSSELLRAFDVLIVQDVRARAYEAAEVEALADWVARGGGLFTLTGYIVDANTNVNALLAPYGIQYGDTLVLVNPFANQSIPVETWSEHPVTRGISKIGVVSSYTVEGGGEVLAEGNDILRGAVVVMRAVEHERGRVLAWGDEWITYNSEWVDRPDYQVLKLWQNTLEWLGPQMSCQLRSF